MYFVCEFETVHVEQILSVINITSDIKLVSNSSAITYDIYDTKGYLTNCSSHTEVSETQNVAMFCAEPNKLILVSEARYLQAHCGASVGAYSLFSKLLILSN